MHALHPPEVAELGAGLGVSKADVAPAETPCVHHVHSPACNRDVDCLHDGARGAAHTCPPERGPNQVHCGVSGSHRRYALSP